MNIGDMILKLRKEKGFSQEEVAEELNVTRQTVSKWETGESKPDFDKIIPLCDLFSITTEELLRGKKSEEVREEIMKKDIKRERAKVLSICTFLYFLSISWIILMDSLQVMSSELSVCIFLLICAISTCILIYHFVSTKKELEKETIKKNDKEKEINGIIALIFTLLYLYLSFTTMMWHLTWLIWIIYAIIVKIVHLIILLSKEESR